MNLFNFMIGMNFSHYLLLGACFLPFVSYLIFVYQEYVDYKNAVREFEEQVK